MLERIEERFRHLAPQGEFCSLRFVHERSEMLEVRQNVLQPVRTSEDSGAMLTVYAGNGMGYAATGDLSLQGLRRAAEQASGWARQSAGHSVVDFSRVRATPPTGEYTTREVVPWHQTPLPDKIDLLRTECARLKTDDRIVDWEAALWYTETDTLYLTTDGGRVYQHFVYLVPMMSATANAGSETQSRSFGGRGYCRQGGLEILDAVGFRTAAPQLASEALQLLSAPNCPVGVMDVVLAPDQMILQIHESIGHPLELDRILGDERNYAGTSFVTTDMFGNYRYGSDLLNITFDPSRPEQYVSYGFDDDGQPAQRAYLIQQGILQRPLGGLTSQIRADLPGVANSRACSWNRPPIDRMANLNLEPGDASLEEMIAAVERGVYMKTNCSWSIDDSRNKFQFGCEWGQLIEHGKLTTVVKNPNYRGISATFWRNLNMVGNSATLEVMGTPNCGKGEPNQVIRVGHASPACLFTHVEVFGGE
ncbi:MAG: TldD/PmbA family protein [Candidatus Tectomicrobia bacterium]|uniref:TldD/PmbA family protein n=1 Tax=Tectimicrobiota bacterium TaxID=2528274 RepID=A0A937VZU7_UNCTE|nr:TldD/PmbA family protein [Candidatus Tectomicrobia bacterium]